MQQKKCRKCKETLDIIDFPSMNMGKYGVGSTCDDCIAGNIKPYEIKRSQKPINAVSKTNKNTPAKFTQETKEEILARDKKCKLCNKNGSEYHHAFFGPIQANYGPDRNKANQGVFLCYDCHHEIHHGNKGKGKLYRAKCIEYLLKL